MNLKQELILLQQKYNQNFGSSQEKFNIFRALCKESDEVRLHSRFIASLLDPSTDNPLGLSSRPLELFLKQIGSKFNVGSKTTLRPGWSSSNWKEDKEIDILIEDKVQKFAIIIENKIYATDSNHPNRGQLEGYHRYVTGQIDNERIKDGEPEKPREPHYKDEEVEVYYLTLDGHKPTDTSLGTKDKEYLHVLSPEKPEEKKAVKLIQYRREICEWLNKLLKDKEVSNRPYIAFSIEQYRELVSKLAGDIELHQELARLVGKYPEEAWNIMQCEDASNLLVQKKKDVLWHGIVDFLNELEKALQDAGLDIQSRTTPLYEAVSNLIFNHKKSDDIYFRIPDKRGFVWTLQSNSHENGKFFLGIDKKTNNIRSGQLPQKLSRDNEDNGWYCRIYLNQKTEDITPEIYLADILKNKETFEYIMIPCKRDKAISILVNFLSGKIKNWS